MSNQEGKTTGKKTKKEQVIELYNSGERNSHIIAKKIGTTAETVQVYLCLARKEGKIEKIEKVNKTKIKKDQAIELYKAGETNPKVIAKKLGIKVEEAKDYLNQAKREGKIKNELKPKTKQEQVVELYKGGEKNLQTIAEKVETTVGTVKFYLSKARKNGEIESKPKTKKEQAIELYKGGETNPKVIAEKVGSTVKTVRDYLSNARKQGIIENKTQKPKTKQEQVLELYNGGKKDPQVIAKIIGSEASYVNSYLSKLRGKGLIEKAPTKQEQVIELYKGGETDQQTIADKVGTTVGTVKFYLNNARRQGIIESKPKTKSKKEQIIELYKTGEKNPQVIAKTLGYREEDVKTCLKKLREEGIIKKAPTKKELITQLYDEGERNPKVISEKLGIGIHTVYTTLYQIRKEENIDLPRKKQENQKKQTIAIKSLDVIVKKLPRVEQVKQKEESQKPIDENLKNRVKVLLETKYPRDIAKQLNIPPRMVYDVMDLLGKEYINKLNVMKVKRSPLYPQIVRLRKSKNLNMERALYVMVKTDFKLKDKMELARIYYLLGNEKIPERLLNDIIFGEVASSIMVQKAIEEKEKILLEIKSRRVREDYKNGRNMDGTVISFNDLCRKYNVRTGFLLETIGQEEIGHEDVEYSR